MENEAGTRLSVVMPTYNRYERLSFCLPLLLAQIEQIDELIILDNNSSDETWKYLSEVGGDYPSVKIIRNEANIGPISSLYKGLDAANGDLISIVPDDDILIGPYFKQVKAAFKENSDLGLVMNRFGSIRANSERSQVTCPPGDDAFLLAFTFSGTITGITFKRSALTLFPFPTKKQILYPHIVPALGISTAYSCSLIQSSGFGPSHWVDDPTTTRITQGRGADMGLCERLSLLQDWDIDELTRFRCSSRLTIWAAELFQEIHESSAVEAQGFLGSIEACFNRTTRMLPISLARTRWRNSMSTPGELSESPSSPNSRFSDLKGIVFGITQGILLLMLRHVPRNLLFRKIYRATMKQ